MTGAVVWITGIAASGKTTFMNALADELVQKGLQPIQLDGDELRGVFRSEDTGFDYRSRLELGRQYSDLCRMLSLQGHLVLIATIALFHEIHAKNRRDFPNYLEVFMDTPLDVVRERDPKGLYSGQSELRNSDLVGVAWKAEFPTQPDFRIRPSAGDEDSGLEGVRERILKICTRDSSVDESCPDE